MIQEVNDSHAHHEVIHGQYPTTATLCDPEKGPLSPLMENYMSR